MNYAIKTNLYLNEKQPWTLIKSNQNISQVEIIIYNVLESTRIIGLLLYPLLPNLSLKIDGQLGNLYKENIPWINQLKWGLIEPGKRLPEPKPIIIKLENE